MLRPPDGGSRGGGNPTSRNGGNDQNYGKSGEISGILLETTPRRARLAVALQRRTTRTHTASLLSFTTTDSRRLESERVAARTTARGTTGVASAASAVRAGAHALAS